MGKATWINVKGAWKQVKNVWVKANGVWKEKVIPKGNIKNVWREFMAYITSWRVKVDTPNRSNRTPVQADKEGNSFFLDYKGVGYSYYLVKYSPDGKLLAEKSLGGYTILGWYIFGDYIYYQEVISSSNYGPIKRININTLEISTLTNSVYKTNFISVDYERDMLVVGTEDYHAQYFKLSTGEQLKNILFAAGQVIGSEYPYYYVKKYVASNNETLIIRFNVEDNNRIVWNYNSKSSNQSENKILGMDEIYIYMLDRVVINSTIKRVFIKLNKSDGKAETTLLGDDYYPYGSDYLLYEGYFYRIKDNWFLEKYSMDFKLLASKNLNIEDGYSYEGLRMVAEVGYLYFTLPSGRGTITNQIWGSEKLI